MQNDFLRVQTSVVRERWHKEERDRTPETQQSAICPAEKGGRDIAFSFPCGPSYMWSEVGITI